jgi:subtilisin-like proprotein convertase family protein
VVPSGFPTLSTGTAPFTGNYTPDESFSPVMDPSAINGTWSLIINDFQFGNSGTLLDWSITFNAANYLTYSWIPTTGLTSPANDTTVAMPTASTNYMFVATDATGCPGMASAQVNVINTPQSTFTINSDTLCVE